MIKAPPFCSAGDCPPSFFPFLHHIPANPLFLVCRHLPLVAPYVMLKTIGNNTTDYVQYFHDSLKLPTLRPLTWQGKKVYPGLFWLQKLNWWCTLVPSPTPSCFVLIRFKLVGLLLPSIIGPVSPYFAALQWLNRMKQCWEISIPSNPIDLRVPNEGEQKSHSP